MNAPRPDQDLIDDLVATVNRHADRMNMGTIFASLMVVASATVHSGNKDGRPLSSETIRGLVGWSTHFLATPHKPENPRSVIELPPGYKPQ